MIGSMRKLDLLNVSYKYSHIEASANIRLLKVERVLDANANVIPGEDVYEYSLVTKSLDGITESALQENALPRYETLSYVWGTPKRKATLKLKDSSLLRITKPLEKALPQIVKHCTTGYLWIDQICINQDDKRERSLQVAIMGKIYSKCHSVLIWLDSIGKQSPGLLPLCNEAGRLPTEGDPSEHNLKPIKEILREHSSDEASLLTLVKGIQAIARHTWFTRAWVYQEIILPRHSRFLLSLSEEMPHHHAIVNLNGLYWILSSTEKMFSFLKSMDWDYLFPGRHSHRARTMLELWKARHIREEESSLYKILSQVAPNVRACEKRDRIYAFFGLHNDFSYKLQSSYECKLRDAFIGTARSIIGGTLSLNVMECIPRSRFSAVPTTLPFRIPSWAPDFRKHYMGHSYTEFCLETFDETKMYPWLGFCDSGILRTHGKKLDVIDIDIGDLGSEATKKDFFMLLDSAIKANQRNQQELEANTSVLMHRCLDAICQGGFKFSNSYREMLDSQVQGASDEVAQQREEQLVEKRVHFGKLLMRYRRLWLTKSGSLVVGALLKSGDIVCILHGCRFPVALSPTWGGKYTTKGICFHENWHLPWEKGLVHWKADEGDVFDIV